MSRVERLLRRLFAHEAIIIILKGFWKTGKTNVGLRIYEELLRMRIIKIAGTNIKIKDSETLKYIEDFETLKQFHYDDPINPAHKLFIFDEAGKIAIRRKAMSKVNVGWMEFLPELSKGRMKLLVITQAEFLTDSIFIDTEFTKGIMTTYKHPKSYSLEVRSDLLGGLPLYLNDFPKTTIEYSPYSPAEWFMQKRTSIDKLFLCCEIARDYALNKKSSAVIANERGWASRVRVMNLLKRHIRHTLKQPTLEDLEEIAREKGYTMKKDE